MKPVLVDQLREGTRVRLNNGWEAVLMDSPSKKNPNTRTATVYGNFTETGSIYVSKIKEAFLDKEWVPVALDENQRNFAAAVSDFLRQQD